MIGNPPFGRANSMVKKFYKKSSEIADYISFILPISQYQNNNELYQFDLIYSEDLGIKNYSNRKLHCCFNIYKRPKIKKEKPNNKLQDIKIIGWRKAKQTDCDFYYCCYGDIGRIVDKNCELVNINGIIIKNKNITNEIVEVFKETNWKKLYPSISTPNLLQWQVVKVLKEQIKGLK